MVVESVYVKPGLPLPWAVCGLVKPGPPLPRVNRLKWALVV